MNAPIVILAATLIALVSRKFNFTPIPVYILLGFTLKHIGLLTPDETTEFLSKLGIVFLLFYIGLKINPKNVRGNVNRITISGFIDFVFNFTPPFIFLVVFGFGLVESFVISSALYISSSAINLKMLIEDRKLIFPFAETVVWLMVFEDLVLILILSILSASESTFIIKLLPTFIFAYALYKLSAVFPKLFNRDDEIPYLITFSIPAAALVIAEKLKVSEALVAIAFGIALSRYKIDKLVIPFKEVFLAIFFISFGAIIGFEISKLTIAIFLIVMAVAGKIAGGYTIALIHKSREDGLEIFKYTLARGEFSVILVSLFAVEHSGIVAAVVLVTSTVAPLLTRVKLS